MLGPGLCFQKGPFKTRKNENRYKGQTLSGNANRDQWMHPQMFPFKAVQPPLPTPTRMASIVEPFNPEQMKQKMTPNRPAKVGDNSSRVSIQSAGDYSSYSQLKIPDVYPGEGIKSEVKDETKETETETQTESVVYIKDEVETGSQAEPSRSDASTQYHDMHESLNESHNIIDEMESSHTYTAQHELETAKAQVTQLKFDLHELSNNSLLSNHMSWQLIDQQVDMMSSLWEAGNTMGTLGKAENDRLRREIIRLEIARDKAQLYNNLSSVRNPKRHGPDVVGGEKRQKTLLDQSIEIRGMETRQSIKTNQDILDAELHLEMEGIMRHEAKMRQKQLRKRELDVASLYEKDYAEKKERGITGRI